MIRGSIHQEDITLLNRYATNIEAHIYIKAILTYLKGEIDSNIMTVGDFNAPL